MTLKPEFIHGPKPTSWVSRLFNGGELERRIAELEAELKVRTDIMNLTSIVSEADKKGDIVSINEKFIEVSKYSRNELIGQPHNTTRQVSLTCPKRPSSRCGPRSGAAIPLGHSQKSRKGRHSLLRGCGGGPILGDNGKPMKYLGVRYDITDVEIERQNARGMVANAIDASYAYIEFDLGGHVLKVNKNFLQVMGYQSGEDLGKRHRMFCDPVVANSPAYQQFWRNLNDGKPQNDVFKRVTNPGADEFSHSKRFMRL